MEFLSDACLWATISLKCMRTSDVRPAKPKSISVSLSSLLILAHCAGQAAVDYKIMIAIDNVIVLTAGFPLLS